MKTRIDITGRRFGRLVVLRWEGYSRSWQSMWRCRCDCGNEVVVMKWNLLRGRTRSCGCLHREYIERVKKYGRTTMGHAKAEGDA